MNPIVSLRWHFANVERSRQLLEEIREGVANLTDVTNRHLIKLQELMQEAPAQTDRAKVPPALAVSAKPAANTDIGA
jgi:hypothetical protein